MTAPIHEYWSFSECDRFPSGVDSNRVTSGRLLRVLVFALAGMGILTALQRSIRSNQRTAIELIRDSGGTVTMVNARSSPTWAYGDAATSGPIESIEIFDPEVVDAALWKTGILNHPDALLALRAPLGDCDVSRLKMFRNLRTLDLYHARVTNDGLVHLQELQNLERLTIRTEFISDAGIRHLGNLPQLQDLVLSSTGMTDEGLISVCQVKSLRELTIAKTRITDAGMNHVARLDGLTRLCIANTAVTDAGLVHLHSLTNLKWLNIEEAAVTERGVDDLQRNLPSCRLFYGR